MSYGVPPHQQYISHTVYRRGLKLQQPELQILRVGVAETIGVSRVLKVYWRPQLIIKISQLFKT